MLGIIQIKRFWLAVAALLLSGQVAVRAQSMESTPVEAASAAAEAAPAPAEVAPELSKEVVVREGYIRLTQHCGENAGGQAEAYGRRASNAVAQIGGFGLLGTLARMAVAGVAGSALGNAVEAPIEERKICVTVAFKDGTPDLKTVVPAVVGERLRRNTTTQVRFEDGKPVFDFN